MEFRILGPVEAAADGGVVVLGSRKLRALLGLLLLEANRVVSSERLIDSLWGERRPANVGNALQVYVSQLRRALREAEAGGEQLLVTKRPGYVLRIEPEQLDLARFESGVAAGRAELAAGRPEEAAALLHDALALWRGEPLEGSDVESGALADVDRLADERLAATADRIEAELRLGLHDSCLSELEALVAANRLHERLAGQLMLALYRAGRQAEALEVFRRTREVLADEIGIDPGHPLRELEHAILTQDPSLDAPARAPVDAPREVRKTVTAVALARVDGDVDPEAARRIDEGAAALAGEIALRYGGSVERSGDTLLAVFGVPAVHEDDALRAVRAALDVREALGGGWTLGVATGDVVAQESTLVAGDTAARAARLSAHARAREILVDTETRDLVAGAVTVESLQRPAGAWRLIDLVPGAPGYVRREDVELLGREGELAELLHAFGRCARERHAHLFTLLGPAGIGKSRLLRELAAALGDEARVLTGRCLPYGDGITFWPLAEAVRQAVPEPTREGIAAVLGDEPDADAIAERIAGAIGAGEVRAGSDAILAAARKLFERLASERPLVLVFDDVHWAEETFLDLVEHLVEWSRTAPLLVVCLARPEFLEERGHWGGLASSTSLILGPLSEEESGRLLDRLFADRPLTPATRARVLAAAEGNPLFLEQMVALLTETGDLGEREQPVPRTISAILAARLDRLPRAERDAIERAAVVGREFWASAVAELVPEHARGGTEAALSALVRKLLVAPARSSLRGESAFRFQHQLIRDVAYESIPKALRADLHARFSVWLERVTGGRELEYQEILGYHLEQAYLYRAELGLGGWEDVGVRGRDLLFAAGRRAVTRGDVPAAISLLSRAAAITPPEDGRRADLLTELAEVLREGGDFARADVVLAEALLLAAASGDRAVQEQARLAQLRVQMATTPDLGAAEIGPVVDAAIDVLTGLGDERRLAKAWFLRAWLEWLGCRATEAAESSRKAAAHAEKAGDERSQAQALHLLLGADLFGPTPIPVARERCEDVMRSLPGQPRIEASAIRALAGLAAMEGRFDEALALLERDQAILQDLGLRVAAAGATEIAGLVHMLAGEPAEAESVLRRGYEAFERMGELASLSTLAAMLAQALLAQGRDEEALLLTEASESAAAEDDLHTQVQWRAARARVLARAGRGDEALALAREAVELGGRTDFLVMRGNAALDLAEVLLAGGDADASAAAARDALALYERKGATTPAATARRLIPPRR